MREERAATTPGSAGGSPLDGAGASPWVAFGGLLDAGVRRLAHASSSTRKA